MGQQSGGGPGCSVSTSGQGHWKEKHGDTMLLHTPSHVGAAETDTYRIM